MKCSLNCCQYLRLLLQLKVICKYNGSDYGGVFGSHSQFSLINSLSYVIHPAHMTMVLTQPLTEMNTRKCFLGGGGVTVV
jgi:hypothetical protein